MLNRCDRVGIYWLNKITYVFNYRHSQLSRRIISKAAKTSCKIQHKNIFSCFLYQNVHILKKNSYSSIKNPEKIFHAWICINMYKYT